ncbi:MAG: 50S ribosomal protein L16 [Candidatus Vidania fulgoroideorum]
MKKKRKFNKFRKGRNKGTNKNNKLTNYSYGLIALKNCNINGKNLEAARKVISRTIKGTGKLIIKIKPNIPRTKKPIEVRMGNGKGDIFEYVFRIKPGSIIFEMECEKEKKAIESLKKCSYKLPFKTKIIKNENIKN